MLSFLLRLLLAGFITWLPIVTSTPPECTEQWFEDGSGIKTCTEMREGVWGTCTYLYDEWQDLVYWDCYVNG